MNLLVITSSFPANPSDGAAAAGLFVKDFCLALAELDQSVTVVTPNKQSGDKYLWPGLNVHWISWAGGDRPLSALKPYRPADALAMASLFTNGRRLLHRLAARQKFDHTLAMWAVPAGLFALGLKRRNGVPYTTWCLGSDIWTYGRHPLLRRIVRRVVLDSDRVYADGLQLAAEVERLTGRPCPFLPSSRRLDRPLVNPLKLPTAPPNFLFVGRYHPVKGVDVLLEAMSLYHAQGAPGHLYLFGGGPSEADIQNRASRDDLRECVTVGGFADEAAYVNHLAACDCVIIPSRMESIPVVFSDALQMGRPLIASDVGDMGTLLRATTAGIIVSPENPHALCAAMIEIAQTDRTRFSPGIETLARQFDLDSTAANWRAEIGTQRYHLAIEKTPM